MSASNFISSAWKSFDFFNDFITKFLITNEGKIEAYLQYKSTNFWRLNDAVWAGCKVYHPCPYEEDPWEDPPYPPEDPPYPPEEPPYPPDELPPYPPDKPCESCWCSSVWTGVWWIGTVTTWGLTTTGYGTLTEKEDVD